MTIIIGYKDYSGELILAADSRTTRPNAPQSDRLQKICSFPSGIVLSFATNDVNWLKGLCRKLQTGLRTKKNGLSGGRLLCRKADSLRRFLEASANRPSDEVCAELLIGVTRSFGISGSNLYYCRTSRDSFIWDEVLPGQIKVCGSGSSEAGINKFQSELGRTLPNVAGPNDYLLTLTAIIDDTYLRFQRQYGRSWKSIGQMVYSLYTRDGLMHMPDTMARSYYIGLKNVDIGIEFNQTTRRYEQINRVTGDRVSLLPINKYDGGTVWRRQFIF